MATAFFRGRFILNLESAELASSELNGQSTYDANIGWEKFRAKVGYLKRANFQSCVPVERDTDHLFDIRSEEKGRFLIGTITDSLRASCKSKRKVTARW